MKCVEYCVKCWKHMNEFMHDKNKKQERAIDWYENVNNKIENSEMTQLKMHVSRRKINLQQSATVRIRRWAWNAKEMERKVEKITQNDIRRHFEM